MNLLNLKIHFGKLGRHLHRWICLALGHTRVGSLAWMATQVLVASLCGVLVSASAREAAASGKDAPAPAASLAKPQVSARGTPSFSSINDDIADAAARHAACLLEQKKAKKEKLGDEAMQVMWSNCKENGPLGGGGSSRNHLQRLV